MHLLPHSPRNRLRCLPFRSVSCPSPTSMHSPTRMSEEERSRDAMRTMLKQTSTQQHHQPSRHVSPPPVLLPHNEILQHPHHHLHAQYALEKRFADVALLSPITPQSSGNSECGGSGSGNEHNTNAQIVPFTQNMFPATNDKFSPHHTRNSSSTSSLRLMIDTPKSNNLAVLSTPADLQPSPGGLIFAMDPEPSGSPTPNDMTTRSSSSGNGWDLASSHSGMISSSSSGSILGSDATTPCMSPPTLFSPYSPAIFQTSNSATMAGLPTSLSFSHSSQSQSHQQRRSLVMNMPIAMKTSLTDGGVPIGSASQSSSHHSDTAPLSTRTIRTLSSAGNANGIRPSPSSLRYASRSNSVAMARPVLGRDASFKVEEDGTSDECNNDKSTEQPEDNHELPIPLPAFSFPKPPPLSALPILNKSLTPEYQQVQQHTFSSTPTSLQQQRYLSQSAKVGTRSIREQQHQASSPGALLRPHQTTPPNNLTATPLRRGSTVGLPSSNSGSKPLLPIHDAQLTLLAALDAHKTSPAKLALLQQQQITHQQQMMQQEQLQLQNQYQSQYGGVGDYYNSNNNNINIYNPPDMLLPPSIHTTVTTNNNTHSPHHLQQQQQPRNWNKSWMQDVICAPELDLATAQADLVREKMAKAGGTGAAGGSGSFQQEMNFSERRKSTSKQRAPEEDAAVFEMDL